MTHIEILDAARARAFARLDLLAQPTPAEADWSATGPLAWLDAQHTTCNFCRSSVAYRDTKVVREVLDYGDQPVYYGQATSLELRVCSWH